jgi:pilus assembly protein CpaD
MTMSRLKPILILALAGTAASGCMYNNEGLSPYRNPTLNAVNQPIVQRTDYVLDLSTGGSGVPAAELDRLDAWFDSLQLGYGDRVAIDAGGNYDDPQARKDVARVAGDYGLLLSDGAPVTAGQPAPGALRIVVSRSVASVPGCPLWDPQEIGSRATTSPNYGCSTNSNLANMIADPNDLVLGQSGSATNDAATSAKAIKSYRAKALTGGGLKSESTGGK